MHSAAIDDRCRRGSTQDKGQILDGSNIPCVTTSQALFTKRLLLFFARNLMLLVLDILEAHNLHFHFPSFSIHIPF